MIALKIRHAEIGIFACYIGINILFGIKLTPFTLDLYGYWGSVLVDTILNCILGIMCIILYDRYKKDLVLVEALKYAQEHSENIPKGRIVRFIVRYSKKNRFVFFLLLSIKDPIIATLYLRKGSYAYNGLCGLQIKLLFFLGMFIINVYWNTVLYSGFSLWHTIRMFFQHHPHIWDSIKEFLQHSYL